MAKGAKMKTKRAAAKRFRVLGSGKIKRAKAGRRHILEHKHTKVKRRLRDKALVDKTQQKQIKKLIPYL